jgi:ATP-dependent Lon protease
MRWRSAVWLAYCPAMADAAPPLLLFVVGPPAVGKMSVGQTIADRTGLRLFHNHIAIELALRYFD